MPQGEANLDGNRTPNPDLTHRELQVLQLLADGLSNKLIADRLQFSEHTAKFHVNNIIVKFDAGTRAGAVGVGFRRGLLT